MEEFTNRNAIGLDKDIILPAEKKVTLQPIHTDVNIDDESDSQIAASHANGMPIGNIAIDSESTSLNDTATPVDTPAQSTHTLPPRAPATQQAITHKSYASVIMMAIVIALLLFALLYR